MNQFGLGFIPYIISLLIICIHYCTKGKTTKKNCIQLQTFKSKLFKEEQI